MDTWAAPLSRGRPPESEGMEMTRAEHKQQAIDDARKWFAKHVARRVEIPGLPSESQRGEVAATLINWAEPGVYCFAVRYLFMGHRLWVTGDCGDFTFAWSSAITPEFVAGCDADYVYGKREAIDRTHLSDDYCEDVAEQDIKTWLAQTSRDENCDDFRIYGYNEFLDENCCNSAMSSREALMQALAESGCKYGVRLKDGSELEDVEFYEHSFGKVTPRWVYLLLEGLRMAVAQLKAGQQVAAA